MLTLCCIVIFLFIFGTGAVMDLKHHVYYYLILLSLFMTRVTMEAHQEHFCVGT